MDQLVDKIQHLEKRIKTPLEDGTESASSRYLARIAELETQQHHLTKQLVELEDKDRIHHREVEAVENERDRVADQLQKVISDHEVLKSKSLELLKRNGFIESENEILRKEKSQLVDNILGLQKSHQDEIQSLRVTLESLGEKLYVVGLDSESKQTLSDLETRHTSEKKNWSEKARQYQESVERLEKEVSTLEAKVEEQHQVIMAYSKMESTLHSEQRRLADLTEEREEILSATGGNEGVYEKLHKDVIERRHTYKQVKECVEICPKNQFVFKGVCFGRNRVGIMGEELKSEVRGLEQARDQAESKSASVQRELERTKQDLGVAREELEALGSLKGELQREKQAVSLRVGPV